MFDIIGFWVGVTILCVPPFLSLGAFLLCTANDQVRKESNNAYSIPLYFKMRNMFGDFDNLWGVLLLLNVPFMVLSFGYIVEGINRYSVVGWISSSAELFSPFFGGLAMVVATFFLVRLLAKMYAKFIILSERVKNL